MNRKDKNRSNFIILCKFKRIYSSVSLPYLAAWEPGKDDNGAVICNMEPRKCVFFSLKIFLSVLIRDGKVEICIVGSFFIYCLFAYWGFEMCNICVRVYKRECVPTTELFETVFLSSSRNPASLYSLYSLQFVESWDKKTAHECCYNMQTDGIAKKIHTRIHIYRILR